MSDILAQLKKVHDAREKVHVHVPEYGWDLYFPPMTVADRETIRRGVRKDDEQALMVNALVHMARTEAGAPFFDVPPAHKPALMAELYRMEFGLLMRIIAQSGGGLGEGVGAEIVAVEAEALRAALLSVAEAGGDLAEAVKAAPEEVLRRALTGIAEAHHAGQSAKNA